MCLLLSGLAKAQQFQLQYFYDQLDDRFHITDLAFPSERRGLAVGVLVDDDRGRVGDAMAVITNDGGENWDPVELTDDDAPLSLFFLDDSVGWMVTEHGLWKTLESGRSWRRVSRHDSGEVDRVWFLNEQRGFAVGSRRSALETNDGGQTWQPIAAAEQLRDGRNAAFTQIVFSGDRGLMVGHAIPDDDGRAMPPVWLFPEAYELLELEPTATLELRTRDGGLTWTGSEAPLVGDMEDAALDGEDALLLFTYRRQAANPSQLVHVNLADGDSSSRFAEPNRRMTGIQLFPESLVGPRAYLVGVEPPGEVPTVPVAGPLKIYRSSDLLDWEELPVDYRALGRRAVVSGPDPEHIWVATDEGMILKLRQEADGGEPQQEGQP